MKNKIVAFSLLVGLSTTLYAEFSNSLNFISSVDTTCGVLVKKTGSIAFENEEPKTMGNFKIISNIDKRKDVLLKAKNIKKSNNIQNINNSNIYVIIDRYKKIRINEFKNKGLKLKPSNHKMYIYIERQRDSILSGKTRLTFDLEVICKY